jgi:hypothetical protein
MSKSEISEEERFHKNMMGLANLIHELISSCWDEGYKNISPSIIGLVKSYLNGYDKIQLISDFIQVSHTYWQEIKDREENFFIEHAYQIFKGLPEDQINLFSLLFTAKNSQGKNIIVDEDRDAIWAFFESFVKISIRYLHRVRVLKLIETENGLIPRYTVKIFPNIKLREWAKIWQVKLDGYPDETK